MSCSLSFLGLILSFPSPLVTTTVVMTVTGDLGAVPFCFLTKGRRFQFVLAHGDGPDDASEFRSRRAVPEPPDDRGVRFQVRRIRHQFERVQQRRNHHDIRHGDGRSDQVPMIFSAAPTVPLLRLLLLLLFLRQVIFQVR